MVSPVGEEGLGICMIDARLSFLPRLDSHQGRIKPEASCVNRTVPGYTAVRRTSSRRKTHRIPTRGHYCAVDAFTGLLPSNKDLLIPALCSRTSVCSKSFGVVLMNPDIFMPLLTACASGEGSF